MRSKNAGMLTLFVAGAAIATVAAPGLANADNWACEVALCISNPAGPMAVSECVPPITKLYHHLERGGSFPLCQSADGHVNFTRYGLEWQEDCPEGTQTVYRRDDRKHGWGRRSRYCQQFVPMSSGRPYRFGRNRDYDASYEVRIVDGERVYGKVVTTRAPRRAKPRYLEYVANGDTRRIWW